MENFKKEFTGLKQNGENSRMKFLRTKNLREWLHVGDSTIQLWRIKGYIKSYRIGRMHFYLEDEINEAILNGKICNN